MIRYNSGSRSGFIAGLTSMLRASLIALLALLSACADFAGKPASPSGGKLALVLGGGAARGFAHIGVIKALEAQGIVPDMIVGTSAGSVVAAFYAGGNNGFQLQKLALEMEDGAVTDWVIPDRGFIRGEALQNFVNKALSNRTMNALPRKLAVVATDLRSGELVVLSSGDVGLAVRASSSVPGVFQPVRIGNREFVDGGLVSPVPAKVARDLGADVVIAVDISSKTKNGRRGHPARGRRHQRHRFPVEAPRHPRRREGGRGKNGGDPRRAREDRPSRLRAALIPREKFSGRKA